MGDQGPEAVVSEPMSPSIQAAAAAASRRRKQSKPRQLASTDVDNEETTTASTAAQDERGIPSNEDSPRVLKQVTCCSTCHVTFNDERQFVDHTYRCRSAVAMATDYRDDNNDEDDVYPSSSECSEPEMTQSTNRRPEAGEYENGEWRRTHLQTDPDFRYLNRSPETENKPLNDVRQVQSADEEDDDDDNDDEDDEARYQYPIEQCSSPYNLSTGNRQSLPEEYSTAIGVTSSRIAADFAARMLTFDSNMSPATKIAMLESAVFGLHRQQMIQLELIESLRRQLAAAIQAAQAQVVVNPSQASDPSQTRSVHASQQPLTAAMLSPDMASQAALFGSLLNANGNGGGSSSLSNLMKMSAVVERQASSGGHCKLASSPGAKEPAEPTSRRGGETELMTRNPDEDELSKSCAITLNKTIAGGSLADLSLFKKAKPPNVTVGKISEQPAVADPSMTSSSSGPGSEDAAMFKHRCHMCLKVLGSDSALQIHMRSHTGERPYKCNICGNRFTTKGNLKVHFQRHLEQYPNARMNPDPVPEYLDHQPLQSEQPCYPVTPTALDRQYQTASTSLTPSTPSSCEIPLMMTSQSASGRHFLPESTQPTGTNSAMTSQLLKQEASANSVYDKTPEVVSHLGTETDTTTIAASNQPHHLPSPLSALSSMSSALSTSFPLQSAMRGGAFPVSVPLPGTAITVSGQTHAAAMQILPPVTSSNSPSMAASFSSPFRPPTMPLVGVPTPASGPLLPLPPLKPDLDDDEALEQYMEIQQTDTSKIEELVREATAAALEGKNGEGLSDPNECVLCHRVLSCRSALQMHYRTHTGERPYRCRLCGRTFTTKGNLKTHMTVHRTRNPGGFVGSPAGLVSGSGHRCPICRREFAGSLTLQQHIRAAHSSNAIPALGANSASSAPVSGAGVLPPQLAGPLGGIPFPGALQPGNAQGTVAGQPNAAAMAAAAAMMMMPGLNPLLPFINFPFYAAAPPGSAIGPLSQSSAMFGQSPTVANVRQKHQAGDGLELDLRKNVRDSDQKDKRNERNEDDDDLRNDEKRRKFHDETVADLSSGRDTKTGDEWLRRHSCRQDLADDEDDIEMSRSDCRSSFDYSMTSRGGNDVTDDVQKTVVVDSSSLVGKFASPLAALEQRLNAIGRNEMSQQRRDLHRVDGHLATEDENNDEDDENWDSMGDNEDLDDDQEDLSRQGAFSDEMRRCDARLQGSDSEAGHHETARQSQSPLFRDGDEQSDSLESSVGSNSISGIMTMSDVKREEQAHKSNNQEQSSPKLPSHPHHHQHQQQTSSSPAASARFVCTICSKPFASASALEIHSRTHSGDRPFVCHVCHKAFTTKGNLKVHMGTHAWNRCPSRRGRRMSVVDPATAAVAAAAVAASGGTTAASGFNKLPSNAPPPPSSSVEFLAAAAAAGVTNPFAQFVAGAGRPMSVFGYAPPTCAPLSLPSATPTSVVGFFPDVRHQMLGFCTGNTNGGGFVGQQQLIGDADRKWMMGVSGDERNNNNNSGSRKTSPSSLLVGGGNVPRGFQGPSAITGKPCFNMVDVRSDVIADTGNVGGELDLSVTRNTVKGIGQPSAGRSSTGSSSSSNSNLTSSSLRDFDNRPAYRGGTSNVTSGWPAGGQGAAGDHRGPTQLTAVMSNCG